jgi:hypothetical protein
MIYIYIYTIKQSNYRPGQALRVLGGWGSQISRQSAHEYKKVVSFTHRSPLPPEIILGTPFYRKVAGPIPDGVTGYFHWHNPSGCTMALGSTQHLTEMSTRINYWSKGGRCIGLTNCHLHVPIVLKSGSLNLLEHSGPVKACNGIDLPFTLLSFVRGWVNARALVWSEELCRQKIPVAPSGIFF